MAALSKQMTLFIDPPVRFPKVHKLRILPEKSNLLYRKDLPTPYWREALLTRARHLAARMQHGPGTAGLGPGGKSATGLAPVTGADAGSGRRRCPAAPAPARSDGPAAAHARGGSTAPRSLGPRPRMIGFPMTGWRPGGPSRAAGRRPTDAIPFWPVAPPRAARPVGRARFPTTRLARPDRRQGPEKGPLACAWSSEFYYDRTYSAKRTERPGRRARIVGMVEQVLREPGLLDRADAKARRGPLGAHSAGRALS